MILKALLIKIEQNMYIFKEKVLGVASVFEWFKKKIKNTLKILITEIWKNKICVKII